MDVVAIRLLVLIRAKEILDRRVRDGQWRIAQTKDGSGEQFGNEERCDKRADGDYGEPTMPSHVIRRQANTAAAVLPANE